MKKILLLTVTLLNILILSAQGVYQLWGMTPQGGSEGLGVIFNTNAAGDNFKLAYQFDKYNPGNRPVQELTEYNGKFYGMTIWGGNYNGGVIFEWDPSTNIYTKKIDFNKPDDRILPQPSGNLTLDNGKFYGTTQYGGNNGVGTIFEWDPATNIYIEKIVFTNGEEGVNPKGSLLKVGDKFYGIGGGGIYGVGVIFEWDPATNIYSKKFDFDSINGAWPSSLIKNGSKYYGTTLLGGTSDAGVIFEYNPATNVYTKKIDFDGVNAGLPSGGLTFNNNKFYGTSSYGGENNRGIIFEWDPVTNQYSKKVNLNAGLGNYYVSNLTKYGEKFYGTIAVGDTSRGWIFEWDPASNIYTEKILFDYLDGSWPQSGLTLYNGTLYGMTAYGGTTDGGVIYSWSPGTNTYAKKIDFNSSGGPVSGYRPSGKLTRQRGEFYGTTQNGGNYDHGVIFKWNPELKEYIKKIDFNYREGAFPRGNLIYYKDNFYGMTGGGGPNEAGVIFKWNPITNIYTKKVDFTGNNGGWVFGSLTLYNDKFYGMTFHGGDNNEGVIFEWDPVTNILKKKVDFVGLNGSYPTGDLTLFNGKFYGVTSAGGINDKGVIFEWDPATNIYSKKFDFNGINGSTPYGNLVISAGIFYGTTFAGGANNTGVIFQWNPIANIYTKKFDFTLINGINPIGSLTLSNAKFYGMAEMGGSNNKGVIFEWDPTTNVYIKKLDFNGTNGEYPVFGNDFILSPALVSKGLPGSCKTFPSVIIDNSNNNQWVSITDEDNNAVAEIKANGNNLGVVTASVFINNGKVREDGTGRLYLDRSITLTSQYPQKSAVDIRLYIKGTEYTALKTAHNSFGQTAGINSINDVGIFKIKSGCAPAAANISNLINTTGAAWENDYVLSASINSFTSFYFASKNPCAAPVISPVSASASALSPADHQMKNVTINYSATGNCFPITTWLTVTSNEPVSGTGNGDLSPDWIIIDDHHVQLRAETAGSSSSRIYTIAVNAKNAFGTYCKKSIKVSVPCQSTVLAKGVFTGNENDELDCRVTPNPSGNYFNLQVTTASSEKIEVSVFDVNGRKMSKMNTLKNQTLRFGNNLRPGAYMIKVTQGEQQKIIKIIKE